MNWVAVAIAGVYGFLFVVFATLIIYLIIRRINIKKDEDFEDREN